MKDKKRLINIILIVLGMMLCFSGCGTKNNDLFTYYSDFEGLSMKIISIEMLEESTTVRVRWNNNTAYEITHGNWYTIEYLVDDEWKSCATVDEEKPTFDLKMSPDETKNKSYAWGKEYDLSKEGRYRIRTQCYVLLTDEGDGTPKLCNMCVEFDVDEHENLF